MTKILWFFLIRYSTAASESNHIYVRTNRRCRSQQRKIFERQALNASQKSVASREKNIRIRMKFNTLEGSEWVLRWRARRVEERENIDECSNYLNECDHHRQHVYAIIINTPMCICINERNHWIWNVRKRNKKNYIAEYVCIYCVRDFTYRQPVSRTLKARWNRCAFTCSSTNTYNIIIVINTRKWCSKTCGCTDPHWLRNFAD